MTLEWQWQLVQATEPLVPVVTTLIVLFALRRPLRFRWRAVIAVLVAWVLHVIFIIGVFNPVGIAQAEKEGSSTPWEGFDNNDNLGVLILGWLIPFIMVLLVMLCRWAWRRFYPASSS